MKHYGAAFKQYAVFAGRASRKEYWMFILFNIIFSTVAAVLDALLLLPFVFTGLYSLVIFLPSLSVMVRRLHDTGKSGWWYWISLVPFGGIVLLIFLASAGDPGENLYGPSPYAPVYSDGPAIMPNYTPTEPNWVDQGANYVAPAFNPSGASEKTVFADNAMDWNTTAASTAQGIRLMLVGIGGSQTGLEYEIFDQGHTIGRDPSMSIRYPVDEKGVSRQHCRVFWNNGALVVMDMNSSGGTYIQGKGRIPVGVPVPLSENDTIYLGSKNNALQFRVKS